MLPQEDRTHWYTGWQAAFGLTSFGGAFVYVLTQPYEPQEYIFAVPTEMLIWSLVPGVVAALLWLPIAWWTWRPYVITPPGLGDDDEF